MRGKYGFLVVVLALVAVAAYFVLFSTPRVDPLAKVEASKLSELDGAAKKGEKSERDKAVDDSLIKLQGDYDTAADKSAFLKALNTRLEGLPSPTRIKAESDKLVRDAEATGPTGTPTTKPPVPKAKAEGTIPADLLSYLRSIAKAHPEFRVNDVARPFSFSPPLDTLTEDSKEKLAHSSAIELKKDGHNVDKDVGGKFKVDVKQVHLVLSEDMKRFTTAYVFFKAQVNGKAFPEKADDVLKMPVELDTGEYTEVNCNKLAQAILTNLVSRTGVPAGASGYSFRIDVRRGEVVKLPSP